MSYNQAEREPIESTAGLSQQERELLWQPVFVAMNQAEAAEKAIIAARQALITAIPGLTDALQTESWTDINKVAWQSEAHSLDEFWLELKLGERTYFIYYYQKDYPNLGYPKGLTVIPRPEDVIPNWSDQALAIMEPDQWPRQTTDSHEYRAICGIALYYALPELLLRYSPMAEKTIEQLTQSLAAPETR